MTEVYGKQAVQQITGKAESYAHRARRVQLEEAELRSCSHFPPQQIAGGEVFHPPGLAQTRSLSAFAGSRGAEEEKTGFHRSLEEVEGDRSAQQTGHHCRTSPS